MIPNIGDVFNFTFTVDGKLVEKKIYTLHKKVNHWYVFISENKKEKFTCRRTEFPQHTMKNNGCICSYIFTKIFKDETMYL